MKDPHQALRIATAIVDFALIFLTGLFFYNETKRGTKTTARRGRITTTNYTQTCWGFKILVDALTAIFVASFIALLVFVILRCRRKYFSPTVAKVISALVVLAHMAAVGLCVYRILYTKFYCGKWRIELDGPKIQLIFALVFTVAALLLHSTLLCLVFARPESSASLVPPPLPTSSLPPGQHKAITTRF